MRPFCVCASLLLAGVPALAHAQQAPPLSLAAPAPDSVVFVNGEQLSGTLSSADGSGIVFKSVMAGEIKVKWEKVRELHSDKNFAVLPAGEKLTRRDAAGIVPEGKVHVADQQLTIDTAAGPTTIPLKQADRIVDAEEFERAIHHPPSLLQGWGGTATGGVSIVRATQKSTTFTGGLSLARSTPTVDWLPPRDRTSLDYDQAYGNVSQAGNPTIKTNIFHADAERDQYVTPRVFAFGSATFDHNFSQSLDLRQAYGGGLGITVVRNAHQQLDLKADAHYEKESFFDSTLNENLFGSTFSEKYLRYMFRGIVLNEFGSASPSWNNTKAYSTHVNAGLTFPVFRGLGFNVSAVDDYLNNAPPGSKKNSVQFTTGIVYAVKPR